MTMSADDCVFCKMVTGQIPFVKIFEDDTVLAFLDIGPISDGHTLVISKQHIEKLHDCPAELLGQICSHLGRIAGAVTKAMNSEGYNLLCNNGRPAGQLVKHMHFHIIPRKTGDGVFNRWPSGKYQDGIIETIADKIRQNL
jgi:histidine triad (HIT) family protein